MLLRDPHPTYQTQDNLETWERFRADVWAGYGEARNQTDKVGQKLSEFRTQMESLYRPIVDRGYGKAPRKGVFGRVADWFGMS